MLYAIFFVLSFFFCSKSFTGSGMSCLSALVSPPQQKSFEEVLNPWDFDTAEFKRALNNDDIPRATRLLQAHPSVIIWAIRGEGVRGSQALRALKKADLNFKKECGYDFLRAVLRSQSPGVETDGLNCLIAYSIDHGADPNYAIANRYDKEELEAEVRPDKTIMNELFFIADAHQYVPYHLRH